MIDMEKTNLQRYADYYYNNKSLRMAVKKTFQSFKTWSHGNFKKWGKSFTIFAHFTARRHLMKVFKLESGEYTSFIPSPA